MEPDDEPDGQADDLGADSSDLGADSSDPEPTLEELKERHDRLVAQQTSLEERTKRSYGIELDQVDLFLRRLNAVIEMIMPDPRARLMFEIGWQEFLVHEQEKLWNRMELDPNIERGRTATPPQKEGLVLPGRGSGARVGSPRPR